MEMSEMYSEVYEILKLLGKEYTEKLPPKLYEHIQNERNPRSTKEFYIDKPIEEQDIKIETLEFISFLNLHYWCTEEEKINLLKVYNENDLKYEKEKKILKTLDINNSDTVQNNTEIARNQNDVVEYKDNFIKNILKKLLNWIKR